MSKEEIIKSAIDALNAGRNVYFKEIAGSTGLYRTELDLGFETIAIGIDCNQGFPEKFPVFKVIEPRRFYPHVEEDGRICLFDDSALIIRADLPEQIMIDAFDRALEILTIKPGSLYYKKEVAREFNAYWVQKAASIIYTNLSALSGNEYKELKCLSSGNNNIVSDSVIESEYMLCNYFGKDIKKTETTCMLIRLRSFDVPPMKAKYSWKDIRTFIINNVTASQKEQFRTFLDRKLKILNRYIILAIPAQERDFYIGFWIHHRSQHYAKVEKMTDCRVEPIMTRPIDRSYMLRRGGAMDNILDEKTVLLIGCGSIGGFVAADLCQSGIESLDILDKDRLSIDNVHRHILGFTDAVKEKYKADLMRDYLVDNYPHVEIDPLDYKDRSAEAFLESPERLKQYDIIISATGEPMLNLAINKALYDNDIHTPLVVCFNEPYGIGGHAIAVNIDGGCLQCLYTDVISDDLTSFCGSFVEPNQDFKKSVSGCAGSFVEYSVLDSQQTAIITVRLSLQILLGKCKKNKVVSWVGREKELTDHGYKVSEYYKHVLDKQGGIVSKDIIINQRCNICKS